MPPPKSAVELVSDPNAPEWMKRDVLAQYPELAAKAKLAPTPKEPKAPPDVPESVLRGFQQVFSGGSSDEAAGLGAKFHDFVTGNKDQRSTVRGSMTNMAGPSSYEVERKAQDERNKAALEAHKAAYMAGGGLGIGAQMAAGGALGAGARLVSPALAAMRGGLGTAMLTGAGSGALAGAASADPGHRLEGAGQGAVGGAILSQAAPAVMGLLGPLAPAIGRAASKLRVKAAGAGPNDLANLAGQGRNATNELGQAIEKYGLQGEGVLPSGHEGYGERAEALHTQGTNELNNLIEQARIRPAGVQQPAIPPASPGPMLPPPGNEMVPMPGVGQLRQVPLEVRKGVRGISGMNGVGKGEQMPDAEYLIAKRSGTVRPNAPTMPAPPPQPLLDTPAPKDLFLGGANSLDEVAKRDAVFAEPNPDLRQKPWRNGLRVVKGGKLETAQTEPAIIQSPAERRIMSLANSGHTQDAHLEIEMALERGDITREQSWELERAVNGQSPLPSDDEILRRAARIRMKEATRMAEEGKPNPFSEVASQSGSRGIQVDMNPVAEKLLQQASVLENTATGKALGKALEKKAYAYAERPYSVEEAITEKRQLDAKAFDAKGQKKSEIAKQAAKEGAMVREAIEASLKEHPDLLSAYKAANEKVSTALNVKALGKGEDMRAARGAGMKDAAALALGAGALHFNNPLGYPIIAFEAAKAAGVPMNAMGSGALRAGQNAIVGGGRGFVPATISGLVAPELLRQQGNGL